MNVWETIKDIPNECYMHIVITEDGDIFPLDFVKPTETDMF